MADPIQISEGVFVPASALQVSAVRASGPGGQNVNKVSSKVDLRVDLAAIVGLSDGARQRLDADGHLLVLSQKTRDQPRNLADAYDKVRALVRAAMIEPARRKKTRPSRGAVERRLSEKHHAAQRKRGRSRASED
jgi:ribosome-associated protein